MSTRSSARQLADRAPKPKPAAPAPTEPVQPRSSAERLAAQRRGIPVEPEPEPAGPVRPPHVAGTTNTPAQLAELARAGIVPPPASSRPVSSADVLAAQLQHRYRDVPGSRDLRNASSWRALLRRQLLLDGYVEESPDQADRVARYTVAWSGDVRDVSARIVADQRALFARRAAERPMRAFLS